MSIMKIQKFRLIVKINLVIVLTISFILPNPYSISMFLTEAKVENTPEPFFHVNLIVPVDNPLRMHAVDLIAQELESIGISTDIYFISTTIPWYARGLSQEVDQFSEGGYDITTLNALAGIQDRRFGRHWTDSGIGIEQHFELFPGLGYNIGYWSPETGNDYYTYLAGESQDLLDALKSTRNRTLQKQFLTEWQKNVYDALPMISLPRFPERTYFVSNGLYGFDFAFTPFQSMETVWTDTSYTGTPNQVVIATDAELNPFNTIKDRDSTTLNFFSPVMDGLIGKTPSNMLVLPNETIRDSWMTTQFGTSERMDLYPRVASKFGNFSLDGTRYNITVRDDVYWHDGHLLDAWDIVFSFQSRLVPEVNYPERLTLRNIFGIDNKSESNGVYGINALDINNDSFFETITFNIEDNETAYLFESDILGLYLVPEHILGDPINHGFNASDFFVPEETWITPPIEWENHSYNTGNPLDHGGLKGPIGCGSLIFEEFIEENGTVRMKKFENIQWDNSSGNWVSNSTNDHFLIKTGRLDQMPLGFLVKSMDLNISLELMKTGEVNIIDWISYGNAYNFGDAKAQEIFDFLKEVSQATEFNIVQTSSAYTGFFSYMYFNPKFTTHTSLSSTDRPFNKKGVHHAISHIIPRELINEKLFEGFGQFSTIPGLSSELYGHITDNELISFKQSLEATDGTFPEVSTETALDSYDRQLALDWLATEGYDVTEWRDWVPKTLPAWVTNEAQQWDEKIQKGTSIEFKIDSLRDENQSQSWYWDAADVKLFEGDTIRITWLDDPDTQNKFSVEDYERIQYPISVSIGGKTLDSEHSKQFAFFILPLVTTNPFGQQESGLHSVQKHFASSYPLLNNWWGIDMLGDPDLFEVGGSANPGEEVHGRIVTYADWITKEDNVFNVTY